MVSASAFCRLVAKGDAQPGGLLAETLPVAEDAQGKRQSAERALGCLVHGHDVGRGAAENAHCAQHPGVDHGRLSGVVARGRSLLFVDSSWASSRTIRPISGSGAKRALRAPTTTSSNPGAATAPGVVALASVNCEWRTPDPARESGQEATHGLRREGDLGYQHEPAPRPGADAPPRPAGRSRSCLSRSRRVAGMGSDGLTWAAAANPARHCDQTGPDHGVKLGCLRWGRTPSRRADRAGPRLRPGTPGPGSRDAADPPNAPRFRRRPR